MKFIRSPFMLLALGSMLLLSCSPLSRSVRREAESGISFEAIRQAPEAYVGKKVVLGGYIIDIRNLPQATRMTVLQSPLSAQDRPRGREKSQGRFIAVYDGFLDPAVYEEGRVVTMAGTVLGSEVLQVNEHSYATFAVKSIETHLWEKEQLRPSPNYYDPFYYPYFYDPWLWPEPPFRRHSHSKRR